MLPPATPAAATYTETFESVAQLLSQSATVVPALVEVVPQVPLLQHHMLPPAFGAPSAFVPLSVAEAKRQAGLDADVKAITGGDSPFADLVTALHPPSFALYAARPEDFELLRKASADPDLRQALLSRASEAAKVTLVKLREVISRKQGRGMQVYLSAETATRADAGSISIVDFTWEAH